MESTGLSDKGKQLMTQAGQLREDLFISHVTNASVERMREKVQEELRAGNPITT